MTRIHRPASDEHDEDAIGNRADDGADDLALLLRLRGGEDAAFGELFSRHCDAVRRLALGLAADRAEAEDLTAEAFFRVLQAIKRGSGPVENVRGYLLIVTRRVAWEWNGRRRDVPVSDDELDFRVGADQDRSGQAAERSLITRAFSSLPERWRSVLWEVEVEGARPAVVAGSFGLSPNATAALARRARQGLRAAYLQAHLAIDRGSTGCRSVLEKLGAYTAGTIKGVERRKVRVHLSTCASCAAMFDELRDVCSGLRAHAGVLAAPVAGVAVWQHMGTAAGVTAKGLLANVKIQVALAASSAAAVGVFGFVMVALGGPDRASEGYLGLDGGGPEAVLTQPTSTTAVTSASEAAVVAEPPRRASAVQSAPVTSAQPQSADHAIANAGPLAVPATTPPVGAQRPAQPPVVTTTPPRPEQGIAAAPRSDAGYDENQPVISEDSSYQRQVVWNGSEWVVQETATTTRVNAANQTTVATSTTEYKTYDPAAWFPK